MATRTKPALLEREGELDELQAALADAARGSGRLIVIEGEAGIGKSRLLDAAGEAAERAGMEVLSARGTELERDFPFALVSQLFGAAVHDASQVDREEILDEAARPAGPIVGIDPSDVDAGYLPDASFGILNALFWLTSNLAERTPLLLAVDDAHWSDQASLRFLIFLLPRLADLPVALALSVRTGERGTESELLGQLGTDPAAHVIRPGPLGGISVAELVRAELTNEAADAFCAACQEATGGNPFMLHELLRELRADNSSGNAADAQRIRELAPQAIQRAVLARLGRLSPEARMLAQAVAVLGDDAELRDAAELAALEDPSAAAAAADALTGAGLLEAGRPLRFAHPLLRNAVYADLAGAEREAFHRRAAEQLLKAGAETERVGVHLLATDPRGDQQVVETLGAAGRRAAAHGASEAAVAYLRRALAEPPMPAMRPELRRVLLTASFRSLDQAALAELDADVLAELTADRQALYGVASELGPLLLVSGRTEEGLALFDEAKGAAVEAEDYGLVIRFDAQIELWAGLSGREDPDWDRHAGRLAEDSPGERLRLAMKAYSGIRSSEPAASVAKCALAAVRDGSIFREQPDAAITALPIWVLIRVDELDEAERAIEHFSHEASARGPAPVIAGIWMRGALAYARGQIALAEPHMRDAVERARAGGFLSVVSDWVGVLAEVLIERGALDGAEHELNDAGFGEPLPDKIRFSQALHSRGCLRLAQGRTSEGLEDLTMLSERLERYGWSNPLYPTDAVAAMALAGAGEREAARAAAERYNRAAERWGTPRAKGIALHCRGVVEGGARGVELLRDAIETLRRSPAQLELARALTDLGSSLRRANMRAAAREPLREALEIARRDGALATARRAHEELEATGEKLRPLMAGGVESLTPSERRVASLAAEGKTNRAIAQELFLTVKTIEAHLSSAYRKLDVASRSELPDALRAPA